MRTDKMMFITLSTALLTGLAYAKEPRLPPPDSERASIGITVNADSPIGIKMPVIQVYFVRLTDSGEAYILPSNYSKKNQVYLLNATPGRYVAVAAKLRGGGAGGGTTNFEVYFPKDMIVATDVIVPRGKMVFMGEFSLKSSTKMSEADEAQAHYFRLLSPDAARKGGGGRMLDAMMGLTNKLPYRGELVETARGREAELSFWTQAKEKIFKDEPAWVAAIDHHVNTLGRNEARAETSTSPQDLPPWKRETALRTRGPTTTKVALKDGKTYDVQTYNGVPGRFESPDIKVSYLGYRATIVAGSEKATDFAWQFQAELRAKGDFTVTVTSALDPTVSTTFKQEGPAAIDERFLFYSRDYPTLWTWVDDPETSWVPVTFSFADKGSRKKFEFTQWSVFSASDKKETREMIRKMVEVPEKK